MPSQEAEDGIVQILAGEAIERNVYTPEAASAVAEGFAFDSDPNWMYDDLGARRKIALSEAGKVFARRQGWVCKCHGCTVGFTLARYCATCRDSGNAFGWYDGDWCAMDWLSSHRDVIEERRRRGDKYWVPQGHVRVEEHRN